MDFQFDADAVSQWVVKFGVSLRPPTVLHEDKARMQNYCSMLTEKFPSFFETMSAGPNHIRVDKSFLLANQKRINMNSFSFTQTGAVFTFPKRIFVDEPQDFAFSGIDKVFLEALSEMRMQFPDRAVVRVGVINEMVFDCGGENSLEIVSSRLKSSTWQSLARNVRIFLEMPEQDKNVNVEIRPTQVAARRGSRAQKLPEPKFGVIVNVDINNKKVGEDLGTSQIRQIIDFADAYVPQRLVELLNTVD